MKEIDSLESECDRGLPTGGFMFKVLPTGGFMFLLKYI